MILNIEKILKPKTGQKLISYRERDIVNNKIKRFYIKDWSFGKNRDDLRYIRYTKTKNGWRKQMFYIKDDIDLEEIQIPSSLFERIDYI